MMKVSIIIPIYNVEQYLRDCLDSAISQTMKEIEIICVNDCSPDNSSSIVEEYMLKDSRVKLINRESNGGLSAARNSGLEIAQGEYIYFLDSDDWIDLDFIESMYNSAIENNANIVSTLSAYKYIEGETELLIPTDRTKNLDINCFADYKDAIYGSHIGAPFKLFKKSFLDEYNLTFPEGYLYEDLYFQYLACYYAKQVYIVKNSSYYYRIRPESIITSPENKLEWDMGHYKIFKCIFDYFKKNNIIDDLNVKLFIDRIIFTNLTEEKFYLFKEFFTEIAYLVTKNSHLYSEKELVFTDLLLRTNTYEEYNEKYNKKFDLVVIRERIRRKK